MEEDGRQVIDLAFGSTPKKLKGEYIDVYEAVKSEILYITWFDENSNLGTTYLGRGNMTGSDKIKTEKRFPIGEQGYTKYDISSMNGASI